jgi:hypothetical protein
LFDHSSLGYYTIISNVSSVKGGIKLKDWEASYIAGIIDGEGSITLTRMHKGEHRRPCITIASTDKELLIYLKNLTDGAK